MRPRWATAGGLLAIVPLTLVVAIELRWVRGAVVRDLVGPAIVAVVLAGAGSGLLSRTVAGWPRVPLRIWARAWLRFLGLMAAGMVLMAALFVGLVAAWRGTTPWWFGLPLLRFLLFGVAAAFPIAALARLVARPPEPPPITSRCVR